MTSANGFIDRAARTAGRLPLPRIVATMLGVATAFFCFAMPQDVLDALLGGFGLQGPVGMVGRGLFLLFFTALAAGLGWLVLTVASGASAVLEIEPDIDLAPVQPRRRNFAPSDPSEAINAPPPTLLAVRRGDSHPDAPPRRPIFADHDLALIGEENDDPAAELAPASSLRAVEAAPADESALENQDGSEGLDTAAERHGQIEPVEPVPAAAQGTAPEDDAEVRTAPEEHEPLDLTEALPLEIEIEAEAQAQAEPEAEAQAQAEPEAEPEPRHHTAPQPVDAEGSLGELMARLETGLERRAGDASQSADRSLMGPDAMPAPEEALRQALDALQRMAARQR
jgi:hypothetical protein